MNNLRHCIFKEEKDGEQYKGYFHIWAQISVGRTAFMRGIVEKENGEVVQVPPSLITFKDKVKGDFTLHTHRYNDTNADILSGRGLKPIERHSSLPSPYREYP